MAPSLKRLMACRRGNVLVIATATMPLLIGAAAIGVDAAQWAFARRALQRAADTAALSGANAVLQGYQARQAVDKTLTHNNDIAATAIVENAPAGGAYVGNTEAVRVILSATPSLPFVSFFITGDTTITAQATAMATPDARYCFVALEDGPQPGFDFSGATGVDLDCGLMTNSKAKPSAVTFGGNSASVRASEVGAVGRLPSSSNYTTGTVLKPFQAPLEDPFASVPEASTYIAGCSNSALNANGTRTISPGCWAGANFSGNITLNPGTYVINGGTLDFGGNAQVTGTGVTFILTGPNSSSIAKLTMAGGAVLNLTAPTSGPLKDLIFYQDRRARYLDNTNTMTGNSSTRFTGAFYFPGSNLNFTGNSSAIATCIRLVARRMSFTGSSAAESTCTSNRASLFGRMVRLVE